MQNIILRTLKMEDAELMLQCMSDPKVYSKMRYNHREIDLDKCISFIENSWTDQRNLHWAISNEKSEYLGTVSLKNIDKDNEKAELGIVVHPVYMGKGIASEALQEIAEKAFNELGLNKIYLYVRCDNERAIAFYKKNQMELEGCAKDHILIHKEYKDVLWFALRKSNYDQWKKLVK